MDSLFAAIPAAGAVSFLAFRESWRAWQPTRHLLAGDYEAARVSAEALERSWMRIIPGIRASARYAVAASLHLMGRLEDSLAATAALDRSRLSAEARSDFDSLDAASLVLLDREPDRIIALVRSATAPEDRALLALALQAKEEPSEPLAADEAPKAAERAPVYHYLVGLHALRAGDVAAAERCFRLAAESPSANVYTRRARMHFQVPTSEDGPSSLAPQVVAKPAP